MAPSEWSERGKSPMPPEEEEEEEEEEEIVYHPIDVNIERGESSSMGSIQVFLPPLMEIGRGESSLLGRIRRFLFPPRMTERGQSYVLPILEVGRGECSWMGIIRRFLFPPTAPESYGLPLLAQERREGYVLPIVDAETGESPWMENIRSIRRYMYPFRVTQTGENYVLPLVVQERWDGYVLPVVDLEAGESSWMGRIRSIRKYVRPFRGSLEKKVQGLWDQIYKNTLAGAGRIIIEVVMDGCSRKELQGKIILLLDSQQKLFFEAVIDVVLLLCAGLKVKSLESILALARPQINRLILEPRYARYIVALVEVLVVADTLLLEDVVEVGNTRGAESADDSEDTSEDTLKRNDSARKFF